MIGQASGWIVSRERLEERLFDASARCISIVAPAGYGKSRLARSLAARVPSLTVCDVHDVISDAGLCRRIVAALLTGGAEDRDDLAQALASLPDAIEHTETWGLLLDAAWSHDGPPNAVVLENAESLVANADLVARVARIAALGGRTLILCSRTDFPSLTFRRMPPGDVVRVGVGDLRFTDDETVELLSRAGARDEQIRRALPLIGGWPVAALLFAAAAASGTLDEGLARAAREDDLGSYVLGEALEGIGVGTLDLLAAAARLRPCGALECAALGTSALDLARATSNHPFFAVEGERLYIHPLARAALVQGDRGIARLADAGAAAEATNPTLAARLYLTARDPDRAAQLLGTTLAGFLHGDVPGELAEMVGEIGTNVLVRHPAAWSATITLRAFADDSFGMLEEARSVWRALPRDADLGLRVSIGFTYANYLFVLGRVDELEHLLGEIKTAIAGMPPDSVPHAVVAVLEGALAARCGHDVDTVALERRVAAVFDHVAALRIIYRLEIEARLADMRMDRDAGRAQIEQAIEIAERANSATFGAIAAVNGAFAAWLHGEDALYQAYLDRIDDRSSPVTEMGTSYFVACARRDPALAVRRNELLYHRTYASIIGAARAAEPGVRRMMAESALDAAREDRSPLVLTLAWLTIALAVPERAAEGYAHALSSAAQLHGDTWVAAIERLRFDGAGPLAALQHRFLGEGGSRTRLIMGLRKVYDGTREISLTQREVTVLAALMSVPASVEATRLAEMVFPDEETTESVRSLRVWISRLRAKLPEYVIVSADGGYRASERLTFGSVYAETLCNKVDAGRQLSADETRFLEAFSADGSDGISHAVVDTEWAAPLLRRRERIRRKAFASLAWDAFARGADDRCVRIALDALDHDPLDEALVELLLRSYKRSGTHADAQRAYRTYESALQEQLGVRPAPALLSLIDVAEM